MGLRIDDVHAGDVWEDENGCKFMVTGKWSEPVVCMREVYPTGETAPKEIMGGVSGLMWNGFARLQRDPAGPPVRPFDPMASLRDALARSRHHSDCAVHNEPASPAGPCYCGSNDDGA